MSVAGAPPAPEPTVVVPEDATVADRMRARQLRQRFLDGLIPLPDRAIVIDLNYLQVLTLSAADELVVRWLDRTRTPRTPTCAIFATASPDHAETIDAALKAAHQAAFRVRSRPSQSDVPEIIGEVTAAQRDTTLRLRALGRWVTAREFGEASQPELSPAASTNRLTDAVARGLALRRDQPGASQFAFPVPLA